MFNIYSLKPIKRYCSQSQARRISIINPGTAKTIQLEKFNPVSFPYKLFQK